MPDDPLAVLGAMPGFLDSAVRALAEDAARARPPGGGFCLVEHLWHLADLEREGFGDRIRRLLAEHEPRMADFEGDRLARERRYAELASTEGLARFTSARADNLRALGGVRDADWDRAGMQEGVGRITLRDLPRLMAEHDASHRDEIQALLAGAGRQGGGSDPTRATGRSPSPPRRRW